MNTLVIVLIAAVCLLGAYTFYGRWLANKWGIDPKAKTPAVVHEDGRDYVPTNGWTVFAHQFSSIAGAGPVTGAIQAAAFGWLPVLLWVLIGGVFFGAVTDFGALYALSLIHIYPRSRFHKFQFCSIFKVLLCCRVSVTACILYIRNA